MEAREMNGHAVVEMIDINKSFPGVQALKNVNFNVDQREIVGLVGENGAGKSTLMKILIGLYPIDQGEMKLRGARVQLSDPKMAIQLGVGMVFQEGCLLSNLTVAENLFLSHENVFKRHGFLSMRKMRAEAEKQLARVEVDLDPNVYVRNISQASRQMVEIARLLWLSGLYGVENPVLVLDEPTTVLLADEIERLFTILRHLKNEASVIFVSHRLEEVLQLSDRIVVLKDGQKMAELKGSEATIHQIEQFMVGHELAEEHYKESEQKEPEEEIVIKIDSLEKKGKFLPLSFAVRKGEILSFVGVLGSGKEEVCRCIAGIMKADSGRISVNGREVKIYSPNDAINVGIGYIPMDRRDEGLALQMDVMSNITLVMLKEVIHGGLIYPQEEKAKASYWVEQLRIKAPSLKALCVNLSGGNQQKIVMAKWLAAKVKVLILDHPTRGIDVGAKQELYKRIRLLAVEGMAIILMSDTLEEDIGLCHRMLIMKDGKMTAEMACHANKKPTPVDIIGYMV
jgi:ribose transport system ATP-binding protein